MLVKNEDRRDFVRDLPFIIARESLVLAYNLVFAPKTLRAVAEFAKLLPATLAKRRFIKARQVTPPRELRRWLSQEARAAGP
jgi:hypothetical protein